MEFLFFFFSFLILKSCVWIVKFRVYKCGQLYSYMKAEHKAKLYAKLWMNFQNEVETTDAVYGYYPSSLNSNWETQ